MRCLGVLTALLAVSLLTGCQTCSPTSLPIVGDSMSHWGAGGCSGGGCNQQISTPMPMMGSCGGNGCHLGTGCGTLSCGDADCSGQCGMGGACCMNGSCGMPGGCGMNGGMAGCGGSMCAGRCGGTCGIARTLAAEAAAHMRARPAHQHLARLKENAHRKCAYGACGARPGPEQGMVTYPYYTTRGPRDFLAAKPPSIGP